VPVLPTNQDGSPHGISQGCGRLGGCNSGGRLTPRRRKPESRHTCIEGAKIRTSACRAVPPPAPERPLDLSSNQPGCVSRRKHSSRSIARIVRCVHGSGLVQTQACSPEQRIRVPAERADKRADSSALDQPATAARFPLPASPAHQVIKVVRTSHGDSAPNMPNSAGPMRAGTSSAGRLMVGPCKGPKPPRSGLPAELLAASLHPRFHLRYPASPLHALGPCAD
jgi:hypothetical protein